MTRPLRFVYLAYLLTAVVSHAATFRAGAARVDITPTGLPVIVNCYMTERVTDQIRSRLYAKALVLDDGRTRLALVIVDSCMMPRELLDRAKAQAAQRTSIPASHMLVAATHTHFAPAAMACLGSDEHAGYPALLAGKIADAVAEAAKRLVPARIGWSSIDDPSHTFNRRWIYEKGKELTDPFGVKSVRANMHPGYQNPSAIGPSGPVDSQLSVLAVQELQSKRPIAVLANYGMHYFNDQPVSNDYFGVFYSKFTSRIGADEDGGFVSIMSQGTSGDLATLDYSQPKAATWTLEEYADGVAASAEKAYRSIRYRDWVPLAIDSSYLRLKRRVADPARLEWARNLAATFTGRKPKTQPEIYAREQLLIAAETERELQLQAVRIGDLAITGIPNEVFSLTGLRLKKQSPFAATFNIELANGADGYIPPPEQHHLGGYTTWAARTAGLEVTAEPQIVNGLLNLLERLSGKPRRPDNPSPETARQPVLALKPDAYLPLDDMSGDNAFLLRKSPNVRARYEGGVARYLSGHTGRAVQFAGGTLTVDGLSLKGDFAIDLWFWPGLLPTTEAAGQAVATLLSAGANRVGISRNGAIWMNDAQVSVPPVTSRAWHHLRFINRDAKLSAIVDGQASTAANTRPWTGRIRFGDDFEGKLDEVAIFSRALR